MPGADPQLTPTPGARRKRWLAAISLVVGAVCLYVCAELAMQAGSLLRPTRPHALPWPFGRYPGLLLWGTLLLAGVGVGNLGLFARLMLGRLNTQRSDPAPQETVAWGTLSWRIDGSLIAALTALMYVTRQLSGDALNAEHVPFGSDWDSFLLGARAFIDGPWSLWPVDKYPLYPVLTGLTARAMGIDNATAAVHVSCAAMTFSTPALYLWARLTVGRRAAVGACLVFAGVGMFNLYAHAVTVYGLFIGLCICQAATVMIAFRSQRLWAWALAGIFTSLIALTEVKALTVSVPLGLISIYALVRTDRGWLYRAAAVALACLPLAGAVRILDTWPQPLTPLSIKLQVNAMEFMSKWAPLSPDAPAQVTDIHSSSSLLPSLWTRLHFNSWWLREELARDYWWFIEALLVLGTLAPLLAWRARSKAERTRSVEGVLAQWLMIGSASGAMTLFFQPKYVVHALPFVLVLAVQGVWTLVDGLLPWRGRVAHTATGWAAVALLMAMLLAPEGVRDPLTEMPYPMSPYRSWVRLLSSPTPAEHTTLRDAVKYIEDTYSPEIEVLTCVKNGRRPLALGLRAPKVFDDHTVHEVLDATLRACQAAVQTLSTVPRVWLVETSLPSYWLEPFATQPQRFTLQQRFNPAVRGVQLSGYSIYLESPTEPLLAEKPTPNPQPN